MHDTAPPPATPGPPEDVARVVQAVLDLPGRPSPAAQAETLARSLGGCLGAGSVTIVLWPPPYSGGDPDPPVTGGGWSTYHWTGGGDATGDGDVVRVGDGGHVLADLTVRPAAAAARLRRWPELLTAVRLLLAGVQDQVAAADAGEQIGHAAAALADARLRAAGEMEQQRYRLERDLHDGAQHHMVALQMSLAMVEYELGAGHPVEAAGHLDRLRHLLTSTEEVLATTATGLLSRPLAEHGLVPALVARLDPLEAVTLDIDPRLADRRYPPEVEAAVYLACLEAVSNAHKHAPGAPVRLSLRTSARGLGFEVADTGPGFDTSGRTPLHNLAARLESVGGTLTVESNPGCGTRVAGFVAI
ncbi:hypothetical protein GCM10027290_54760 [Micromonospora sonneratiae]|jgi:signal transduction histidine kinase|uniref:Sensor histidine kinase n=1 Tax=Micromonospora sonneratiae TaxID=1184706 RepID=A0ABW3YR00_9ACTN